VRINQQEKRIFMRSRGGLANQMFRYMFTEHLSRELGGLQIHGYHLPEWGLVCPGTNPCNGNSITTGRVHVVDVERIRTALASGAADWVDVEAYAMRLEYFAREHTRWRTLFPYTKTAEVSDSEILIHIRAGSIVDGIHSDYMPLPISFYRELIKSTGLRPVFVGELASNWYTDALRIAFQQARFISLDRIGDFQALRGAKHVVTAVSSFSWLATWLSENAAVIHLPLAGLLQPLQRPDIDLIPRADSRYVYHHFEPMDYNASESQKRYLLGL